MERTIEELFHELADRTAPDRELYYDGHRIAPEIRAAVEALLKFDGAPDHELTNSIAGSLEQSLHALDVDEPSERFGPYRLDRLLGRGGMGAVYLAERADGEVSQRVAIKFLPFGGGDPSFLDRFLRERQILANLNHTGIARLIDAGHTAENRPYLTMEYVDGVAIDEFCRNCDLNTNLRTFLKVCDAVSYAHRNLIVHRDLKPSNILVDRTGQPKLLDFGIAKILDEAQDQTQTRDRMLTPDYASPEQVTGAMQTTATDVYSLGAVLYKLLTGQSPHAVHGTNRQDVIDSVRLKDPPRPSNLNANIPRDLDFIAAKALRKEPDERYVSVDALAEDIKAYLESRPVQARSGNAWYRGRKFFRRYWVPVTAIAAAFASLGVGLAVAARERDLADRRFRDVRQIASELFNVERDVNALPGSTAARERIVRTSLSYLENISKDAGRDLALKSEIAAGYRQVADVQGVFRHTNLGHPEEARESLVKAEALLREIWKANPGDPKPLRDLIETIDLQGHIDHGAMNYSRLNDRLKELQELLAIYEPRASNQEADLRFLSAIYDSMAVEAGAMSQVSDSARFAQRAVEQRRQLSDKLKTLTARGELAAALVTYANAVRKAGRLDDAATAFRESTKLLEGILAEQPANYKANVNLANAFSNLGRTEWNADSPSLGLHREAIADLEHGMQIGRATIALDPKEAMGRYNHAVAGFFLGRALRDQDPPGAMHTYDEAIRTITSVPANNLSKELWSVLLAESSYVLRSLHRDGEARMRLNQAAMIADGLRKGNASAAVECDDAITRAEADWALDQGRFKEAESWHQSFIAETESAKPAVVDTTQSMNNAYTMIQRYAKLAIVLRKEGKTDQAERADVKRNEIIAYWKNKLPENPGVERILKN